MKKRPQAEVLRQLLDAAGLSQRAAARELQVSERTMRYYASGKKTIPRPVMFALEQLTGSEGFYQIMAARIRKEAGCSCGEFEINTYEGESPVALSLAGLSPGHCRACADGTTEDVAYRVLKLSRIPAIQPQTRPKITNGRAKK